MKINALYFLPRASRVGRQVGLWCDFSGHFLPFSHSFFIFFFFFFSNPHFSFFSSIFSPFPLYSFPIFCRLLAIFFFYFYILKSPPPSLGFFSFFFFCEVYYIDSVSAPFNSSQKKITGAKAHIYREESNVFRPIYIHTISVYDSLQHQSIKESFAFFLLSFPFLRALKYFLIYYGT